MSSCIPEDPQFYVHSTSFYHRRVYENSTKKRILITGGCGFLGQALLKRWEGKHDVVIFSRDENKHFYVKQKFPYATFILGDIRDYNELKEAAKGCTHAVFAASMKHIDMVSENPRVASEIILGGAINSRKVAEEIGLQAATFISTDKSQSPSTLYGALKMAGAEAFIANARERFQTYPTRLTSLSYGNIFDSSGSLLIKLNQAVQNKTELTLFSEKMTRFGMHVEQAVDLIEEALFNSYNGVSLVPHLWSYRVKDLFEIYAEDFGLNYRMGTPRVGEKLHEIMIPEHYVDRSRKIEKKQVYVIDHKYNGGEVVFVDKDYSSRDYTVSKDFLREYLQKNNYFKHE